MVACAGAEAGAGAAAGAGAGAEVVATESPRTPAEVEPKLIGTVTGATTWVPEAIPSEPLVLAAGVGLVAAAAAAGAAGAAGVAELVAVEPPSRPTDDEPRFMGTVTGATICVPEPMLLEPLVVAVGAGPAPAALEPAAGAETVAAESPNSPSDVPPRLIGAVTGATTCVPERIPSLPLVVSAAFAAVALRTIMPPAKHVPMRHLRMVVFIVVLS
ncbi:hypothetical protein StoSoilB22_31460 [Arthrobacter sp. StoSoilB22]|nr:hypothetical protein StoSoilB22_31460 [Arthrobacter sp. StoSoilB22]